MANINHISLKVCGNPDANGGFQPMVIFNSPSIEIKDTFYTGFDANSYFFTIKIEKNQVVYKLIKNNVSSLGASRQGSLVIGIAIPKGYKLDVASPYDVLMELKKGFITRCMTCKDPATDKYEFKTNRVQPNILDDIAGSYVLVPVQMPYRPMAVGEPIAYITATEEKIAQLMKDVQYPAFTKFSEIVVAESVQSTNYVPISNISIPRMPEYSIYDDGVLQPIVVSDPKQLLTINGKGDPKFYENDSLMFTLEELLNGESVPNVNVDRINEIINVSSKALQKPLTRKISVVFVPKESENYFFTRRNDWALLYGNQTIPLKQDLSFELTGEQLKILYAPQGFRIQQSRKDQYEAKVTSVSSNEIRITAEKVRRLGAGSNGGGKIGSGVILPTSNINACEVQLLLDQAYHRSHCVVQFLNGDDQLLQSSTALFSRSTDDKHQAKVYVPKSWAGTDVHVCLKYKNEHWHSTNNLGRDSNGIIKLRDNDFKCKKIGFFCKHSKGIAILSLMLLSLIAGGVIGAYVTKNYHRSAGNNYQALTCVRCDSVFETQTELTNHMQNVHNGDMGSDGDYPEGSINEPTLTSSDCGKGSFDEDGLASHKPTGPKNVKCDNSDEKLASVSQMSAHVQQKSSDITCNVCQKKINVYRIEEHNKKNHHFECKECGDGVWFMTEDSLNNHINKDYVQGTKNDIQDKNYYYENN